MTEWDIQLRASACNGCNAPFADKQPYHTLLNHTVEGYRRRDLCADCFSGTSRDAVISQWHGKYRLPPPPPPEPIQKDTAEMLLRQLVESNDPTQSGPRYSLAAML